MNCKKCGYTLSPDQAFCPNCKEFNDPKERVNVEQPTSTPSMGYQTMNNQTTMYQTEHQDLNTDYIETKPKKSIFIKILIIIAAIIVGKRLFAFIVYSRNVASTVNKSYNNSFVSRYKMATKAVKFNIIAGEQVACNENCDTLYSLDSNDIILTVKDKGDYYDIILEPKKGTKYYKNVNLNDEDCKDYKNVKCEGKKIVGTVNKNGQ